MEQISEKKLFRSCEILFGSDLNVSWQFLDYLQAGGIKSAFRRRAMETHPDRLTDLDQASRRQGAEHFYSVKEAYDTLLSFLQTKESRMTIVASSQKESAAATGRQKSPVARERAAHPHAATDGGRPGTFQHRTTIKPITLPETHRRTTVYANTESFYQGGLPQRHLLFGHFLYYSGLANWRTISRILTWQRTERPRLGELGKRFGMCRQEDINIILRARSPRRQFGETARMLGILTEHQVRVLVFHQQRMQKKFGTILVEKNLISEQELQELLDRFEHHNTSLQAQ